MRGRTDLIPKDSGGKKRSGVLGQEITDTLATSSTESRLPVKEITLRRNPSKKLCKP